MGLNEAKLSSLRRTEEVSLAIVFLSVTMGMNSKFENTAIAIVLSSITRYGALMIDCRAAVELQYL